jgi:subtilisin family serine protease
MSTSSTDQLREKGAPHGGGTLVRLLLVLVTTGLWVVPPLPHAQAPQREFVLDSTLLALQALRSQPNPPVRLRSLLKSAHVDVSVRFQDALLLTAPSLERMEKELGMAFRRIEGRIAHLGDSAGAQVPWEALDGLAVWPGVVRVDSTWKPALAVPLDVSTREIRAEDVWQLQDAAGWPVTGRGIVIADFDTGIDVFHPDFWRADGGAYAWLDSDGSGTFEPGTDSVDLNGNGSAEAIETLDVIDSTSPSSDAVPGASDGLFYPKTDWLYNDANGNGRRDYGPGSGFGEQDPTYGERLFLLDDRNHNDMVDAGEVLLALQTSKVYKTLDAEGVERRRGVDLMSTPPDVEGHGTHVSSILCGGTVGLRRYIGIAPDSRLLTASFLDSQGSNAYTSYIPWAEANGAQIMLYAFGSWIQEFLDGSSNLEQMLDAASAKGIVQIAAAGNLALTNKHAHVILSAAQPHDLSFAVPYEEGVVDAWLSVLWPGALDAVSLELTAPWGSSVALPGDNSWVAMGDHRVWSYRERSQRGTSRFDILVYRGGSLLAEGNWSLRLRNLTSSWLNSNAYVSSGTPGWTGGVIFRDHTDDMYTVTSPGTADSAITVGSYSTRARGEGTPGSASPFSGQGPRIDGQNALDVSAPGHYADIACASSKDLSGGAFGQYDWFGGTSAAAPHAAGAIALMLQKTPGMSPEQVRAAVRASARQDIHTGFVPNHQWGWGKLDIGSALSAPRKPTPTPRSRLLLPVVIKSLEP